MSKDLIENNPSFTSLKKELKIAKYSRYLIPLLRLLGADTSKAEDALKNIPEIEKELDILSKLPDKFNDIFSDQGWILSETLSIETAKEAVNIYESIGYKEAESILVSYYSPEWVEKHLVYLKYLPEFPERYTLAEKALNDYKCGRYYASILLILTIIDGWVNQLNIIEFQRKGFFDKDTQLVAWDSITAHTKGLVKLQEVFSKSRNKTRSEEITIPYRHGILHGMDLGYDNVIVAAKCWAALFAVRDWVLKARKGELREPNCQKVEKKSLQHSIEELKRIIDEKKSLESWQPRILVVGKDLPCCGKSDEYIINTPERKLIEFFEYWKEKNYGFMAKCYAPMFGKKPIDIRHEYFSKSLLSFKLIEIIDKTSFMTDIIVKVSLSIDGNQKYVLFEIRLILNTKSGEFASILSENTLWGISNIKEITG